MRDAQGNASVRFSTLVTDLQGKPTIVIPQIRGEIGGQLRLNDNQARATSFKTTKFNNELILVDLPAAAAWRSTMEKLLRGLPTDEIERVGRNSAELALTGAVAETAWRVLAQFETGGGTLVITVPLFDPAVQELVKACAA